MKPILVLAFLPLFHCASVFEIQPLERSDVYEDPIEDTDFVFDDIDPEDNLDEDSFEAEFGLDQVSDPEEKEKRQEALKINEELVKEENEEYLNGKKTWWD